MQTFRVALVAFSHKLKDFFFHYKLYRFVYWVLFFFVILRIIGPYSSFEKNVLPALSFSVIHILAAYINIYFFIPFLLYRRHYLTYLIVTSLTILFFCFPLAIITNNFFLTNEFLAANIWTPMFFFVNSAYLLLSVSITSFFHIFSEWFSQNRANKALQELNISNELKFLKSQINPHFLFNSLNSLYALTLTKSDKAPEMVMSLANILRYLLYETSESQVPLEKEINYLNDLIALEKIRMGDRVKICFDIQGDISSIMIEPLLFINFVENSFKHGVNSHKDDAWILIKINADAENKQLSFSIENSKPNENLTVKNERVGGIGLQNTKNRLKLLYPNNHTLQITDKEDSYSVMLKIDLK
ncbi:MAG: histidine kinase [Bacteroidia bacterium]|nr:histidine kinase [Bacteroidia bacterium]